MATGDYCTLTELKEWIAGGISDVSTHDLNLANVITSVSRWIDGYCDRTFASVTEARVFDSCSSTGVCLDDYASISSVKTDDNTDGVFETTWLVSDYQKLPLNAPTGPTPGPYREIRAVGARTFPPAAANGRSGLVEVTGVWGWPEVPATVHQACLIQSHRIFKRRDAPEGMMGFAEFGVVRMQGRLDPDVAGNLDPFVRYAVA